MATRNIKVGYLVSSLAAVAAVGCGGSDQMDAQDSVTTTTEPILGGVQNTGNPAIGLLRTPSGGECTATLISSRVILTAAHCFNFDQTKSGFGTSSGLPNFSPAVSGYTFAIDGAAAPFNILRFAVLRATLGTDDIAVGELQQDVSPSVAVPLKVATQSPQNGVRFNAWGYGCTGLIDLNLPCVVPAGGGTNSSCGDGNACIPVPNNTDSSSGRCFHMVNPGSHKKTLIAATWDATNYRPTTNVGCPGDSGGPYTDSSGNIFGLVSAGTSNRTAPTDRPANPVLHRGFITRMNAAYGNGVVCDTCQKVGFKTFDNVHFLQAVDNGGGSVVATPTQLQEWETFRIVPMGQTFFPLAALQTGKGNWVTAEGGGGANVVANRTLLGSWETFFVTNDGNGVALATISSSKFMTAEGAGGGAVNANRTQAKEWESFVPVVVANALPD